MHHGTDYICTVDDLFEAIRALRSTTNPRKWTPRERELFALLVSIPGGERVAA